MLKIWLVSDTQIHHGDLIDSDLISFQLNRQWSELSLSFPPGASLSAFRQQLAARTSKGISGAEAFSHLVVFPG
jgi:hypothetical protein